jgi:hypothetical protein
MFYILIHWVLPGKLKTREHVFNFSTSDLPIIALKSYLSNFTMYYDYSLFLPKNRNEANFGVSLEDVHVFNCHNWQMLGQNLFIQQTQPIIHLKITLIGLAGCGE